MSSFALLAGILFTYMNVWFLISLLKKRNDVADVAWGLGFILLAWTSFALSPTATMRGLIAGVLVTLWGTRLAWHIHERHAGKPEDYRYAAWRAAWGAWFVPRSYVQVYMLQGALLFIIALPLMLINSSAGNAFGALDMLGVLVWLFGFCFEAIGDAQLARFIKNPTNKGKLMQSGLWAYSRHPNYFGEITQWWGLWLMALAIPFGWMSVLGPLTITFLIVKISGIPLLEKKMEANPAFAAYKKRTSLLIPLPHK